MERSRSNMLTHAAFAVCLFGIGTALQAQDKAADAKPDVNYVTQTTSRIIVPDGMTRDDIGKIYQEYFDKVISKSKILKHYSIYRHAWGSSGATMVTTLEFGSWADIDAFNGTEREALEKAAWPDEAARKAFNKKMDSVNDPYHADEIYEVFNSMRK